MKAHKKMIIDNIEKYSSEEINENNRGKIESVIKKYDWLKEYHNNTVKKLIKYHKSDYKDDNKVIEQLFINQ